MRKTIAFGICAFLFTIFLGLFDSISVNAKMEIPEDAFEYDGHYYYYYSNDSITWDAAKEACEELGGHLVTFTNKAEENAIWRYMGDLGTPAWIGLYNDGAIDRIYQKVGDDWKWVTGEKVRFENWAKTQPDHLSHFLQDSFDMYAAIGRGEEVVFTEVEGILDTPSWGDFDNEYHVGKHDIKGYICEWDIYEINVSNAPKKLKKGKSVTLNVIVTDTAGDKEVKNAKITFKSSKKSVAKVTSKGKVTGLKKGKCTITIKYKDFTKKIKIKVK